MPDKLEKQWDSFGKVVKPSARIKEIWGIITQRQKAEVWPDWIECFQCPFKCQEIDDFELLLKMAHVLTLKFPFIYDNLCHAYLGKERRNTTMLRFHMFNKSICTFPLT